MGKTVPSYRMALEFEIGRWRNFRNALSSVEEKQAFDALTDICRNNAMAGGNACNPVLFEPMVMSILLALQKEMQQLNTNQTKQYGKKPPPRKTTKKPPTTHKAYASTKLIRNLNHK